MTDNFVDEMLDAVRQRQMIMPALLFVAGHRPLAFLLGQTLLVIQPLAALLGLDSLGPWGHLLSQPNGPANLTARLAALQEGEVRPGRRRGADA